MLLETKAKTKVKVKYELKRTSETLNYTTRSPAQQNFINKICSSVREDGRSFYRKHSCITKNLWFHPPAFISGKSTNLELFRVKPVVCWFPHLLYPDSVRCFKCGSKATKPAENDDFIIRACLGVDFPYFAIRQNLRCSGCSVRLNTFSDEFLQAQDYKVRSKWPGLLESKTYMYDRALRK